MTEERKKELSENYARVLEMIEAAKKTRGGDKPVTLLAATKTVPAEDICYLIENCGLKTVEVYVKGPGQGREAAIRALQSAGLEVVMIKDVTPIPHNGCRPPQRRRV